MQATGVRGAVLAVALGVGIGGACHPPRSTAQPTNTVSAAGAASSFDNQRVTEAPPTAAGRELAAPDAGAVTSAGAASRPVARAALPDGVTRRSADQVPALALRTAVTANNEFATALLGALRNESSGKNFFISPISASLALAMTYAGAREQTRAGMARALNFGGQSEESLFNGQNALSQALAERAKLAFEMAQAASQSGQTPPNASDYSLELVNSLWGQAGFRWAPPFLKTLAENFGAGLFERDFRRQSEAARLEINHWVSAQTNDKINDLLPEPAVTATTFLVLVNALHLKLPWAEEFSKAATAPAVFTPSAHPPLMVPFMHRQASYAYRDDGSAQIVGLPLSSRQLWLLIALPHAGVSLASYEGSLRAGSAALVVPPTGALVNLALPKVTFTSPSVSLRDALRRLGMTDAFDPSRARFEGMCQATSPGACPLFVNDVVQKTMISIQETGVEAAAATAVIMQMESMRLRPKPPPIAMDVNRPYLVALVDQPTGALLMLGHFEQPNE